MPDRKMFWLLLRRLLGSNRGRLLTILLALGAGAAVTAALFNLQVDAKRRLTSEFRAFGPNVIIAPPDSQSGSSTAATLDENILASLPQSSAAANINGTANLYLIADATTPTGKTLKISVSGARNIGNANTTGKIDKSADTSKPATADSASNSPATGAAPAQSADLTEGSCFIGSKVASQLQLRVGDSLTLSNTSTSTNCRVSAITSTGSAEDNQVAVGLLAAQNLAQRPARLSLLQIRVPGTPQQIDQYISQLQQQFPTAQVRPLRQFTEAEGKIYNHISGLLTASVIFILVLTGLCVMAAMSNVAMERRNDVGLMKAIGGSVRRVLRLFLAEAAILGLISGILGAALGIAVSIALGKAVFGVAAQPRWIVYPVSVALTIFVAIIGAYPLRRLASIRPASVFRGEA